MKREDFRITADQLVNGLLQSNVDNQSKSILKL